MKYPIQAKLDTNGNMLVNYERWERVADVPDKWLSRYAVLCQHIMPGESVVEFGSSGEAIRKVLPDGCLYQPVDLIKRTPETIVIDLTKENPASIGSSYDVAVYAGVLEYVDNPVDVVRDTLEIAGRVVFSYAIADLSGDIELRRMKNGWFSHLTKADIFEGLARYEIDTVDHGRWHRQDIFAATRSAANIQR